MIYHSFDTPRGSLTIRDYHPDDVYAQADYLYRSDKDFLSSIGFDTDKFVPEEKWIVTVNERRSEALATRGFPILLVAELGGRAVSGVFLDLRHEDKVPRFHFHIFEPSLRGQGFGTLILRVGVETFSRLTGFKSFYIEPKADNVPMNALMRKLGFKHLGEVAMPAGPVTREMVASRYLVELT